MNVLKKQLPIAIAFVLGLLGIILYYLPPKWSQDTITEVSDYLRIILGFALIVGIYSLLNRHYHILKRKQSGWGYSVIVYLAMFLTVFLGFWYTMDVPEKDEFGTWSTAHQTRLLAMNGIQLVDDQASFDAAVAQAEAEGVEPRVVLTTPEENILEGHQYINRVPIQWMYDYVFVPMQATMFSLLAFYIASAAYRAFRARTIEATVLLITAIIMMLGRVPIGEWMWSEFPKLTEWILNTPSMAAQRGIMIGVGLGAIATSLRIIFGIERSYMGGGME